MAEWHKNKKCGTISSGKGKQAIVLEVGGIQRGHTWKVALNGINGEAYFVPDGTR